jgi:hypothetical protein
VIPDIEPTERPADYLHRIGTVFAQFGADTVDSGIVHGSAISLRTAG